jgi:hypothetical protein
MRPDYRGAVIDRPPAAPGRPQWEYKSERMEADADLAQWGAEGWDLVSVVAVSYDPGTARFYFKRRRP